MPDEVKEILKEYGELYPPQVEAINKNVLSGKKLILASPTASGKTLIAELCALKHILEKQEKVLYLVPLRALATEKYQTFLKYKKINRVDGKKIRITVSTGDLDSSDPYLEKYDLIIATNEKVDSLLRHKARWFSDVSLVIADEIHILQDPDRGPTLEVALTRLKQINPNVQILALSATVKNVEELASWIEADFVATDWRPVPLREGVLYSNEIIFRNGASRTILGEYNNPAVNLAVETVKDGGQTLIFVEARRATLTLAKKLENAIKNVISKSEKLALENISQRILSVGEKTNLSEILAKLLKSGVCIHHAGLHFAHRNIIEDNFRNGIIKVLIATPTLAAGVNLPARSVIINNHMRYDPVYGRLEISVLEYKQMAGRAGRPQYDKFGEAILVASSSDEQEYLMDYYVCSEPEQIWSKLTIERTLRSHVLAAISSDFVKSEWELFNFFRGTFSAHQYGEKIIEKPLSKVLKYLVEHEMVKYEGNCLQPTVYGKRISELYIDPETAVIIRDGFQSMPKKITPISFIHLISHTPDLTPRLYPYRREIAHLEIFFEEHKDELMFPIPDQLEERVNYETFLGELKCTEVINSWIEEAKENEILENFKVEPGDLYRIVEMAEWLLYSTHELAKLLGYKEIMPLIDKLQRRVKYGVKFELLPLVTLEDVGRIRARNLFSQGFKSISDLKRASIKEIMEVPGIGYSTAKKIKETVGGKVSRREIEGRSIEKAGIQDSLENFSDSVDNI